MKITIEELEMLGSTYPELKLFIDKAKNDCATRSMLAPMMRSLGRRDGLPESLSWIFSVNPFTPPSGSVTTNITTSKGNMVDEMVKLNEKMDTLIDMLGQVLSRMK